MSFGREQFLVSVSLTLMNIRAKTYKAKRHFF